MPDLVQSLQSLDIGHLRIVARFWGLELTSPDMQIALQELVVGLLDPPLVLEIVEALPPKSQQALEALVTEKGRIPWQEFSRRFGELRDAGMGRRDREQFHLHPVSSTEVLYYRALLGHAFFETLGGTQEFAYIPEDLLSLLPAIDPQKMAIPGRLATPQERKNVVIATDRILDDACTLLSAMRMGWKEHPEGFPLSLPVDTLLEFLRNAGLVDLPTNGGSVLQTHPDEVKAFLEEPRSSSLLHLVKSWLASTSFNELRQVPGLICEGTWTNDPLATRQFILGLLERIPTGKWWSLSSFVWMIHDTCPDFERPSGDYVTWLIRRRVDDTFLHGSEHWDDVDGALIRYILTGPLHWLGILDLASAEKGRAITAFRLSEWSRDLLNGREPSNLPAENGRLHAAANGRISVTLYLPRAVRYQVARFSMWESFRNDEYRYRLTPVSLKNALMQGLKVSHLLSILNKYAAAPLPPSFVRALNRWELNGTEARLEQPVILRLSRPEVLEELRKSRAGRFLGEVLGPTTVAVKPGASIKILAALAELGLLTEDIINADIISSGENHHK
jgi:hypothetical protein